MKIIVYRSKLTNVVTRYDEYIKSITQEKIDAHNNDERFDTKAEIVELEEDSLAYYFYKLKVAQKEDLYQDLKNLEEMINDIGYNIDNRLSDLEELCRGEEND